MLYDHQKKVPMYLRLRHWKWVERFGNPAYQTTEQCQSVGTSFSSHLMEHVVVTLVGGCDGDELAHWPMASMSRKSKAGAYS